MLNLLTSALSLLFGLPPVLSILQLLFGLQPVLFALTLSATILDINLIRPPGNFFVRRRNGHRGGL